MTIHFSFIVFLGLCACQAPPTLRLVNLVYRHGDRSPVSIFPNDPHQVNNSWPDGLGWLTELGIKQQYATGKFLRRRYSEFLSETYKHPEIVVESSIVDRCLMSAYSNLAGLYPPKENQIWNPSIMWQPIPVYNRPESEDNKLVFGEDCPRLTEHFKKLRKSPEVRRKEEDNKALIEFVLRESGVAQASFLGLLQVADPLFCEKQHNLTWAPWVNQTVFDKLQSFMDFYFAIGYQEREVARLTGGALLKQFLENMHTKLNVSAAVPTKMFMYSAHDSTVAAIMGDLQIFNKVQPPYTATLMMELHEENSQYNVQIFYRNFTTTDVNSTRDPIPMTIPGCTPKCPLDKFIALTKDAIPVDWKSECTLESGGSYTSTQTRATTLSSVLHGRMMHKTVPTGRQPFG